MKGNSTILSTTLEEEDSDEDYIYEDLYEDVEFSLWYLCLGPFINGCAVSARRHF